MGLQLRTKKGARLTLHCTFPTEESGGSGGIWGQTGLAQFFLSDSWWNRRGILYWRTLVLPHREKTMVPAPSVPAFRISLPSFNRPNIGSVKPAPLRQCFLR